MSREPLISYAQNGEDVVLWRTLGHVHRGIYVDVGGWDPDVDSVTRLFYDRGWRGLTVEPVPELAEKFRQRRPEDEVEQVVVTDEEVDVALLHRFGATGLSTVSDEIAERHEQAGLDHEDIRVPARRLDDILADSSLIGDEVHFLKIDVEGAEAQALRSVDLRRWRPWVLVVEATEPNSASHTHQLWEPLVLAAGYTFTLFDGVSRFYVSNEHPELVEPSSYPACALDRFEPVQQVELGLTVAELRLKLAASERNLELARDMALRWRREAVNYWANAMAKSQVAQDTATETRTENVKLRRHQARIRENLGEMRAERKQLRARIKRMAVRIERMSARIESMERAEPVRSRSVRARLGAAARRARRE